MTFRWWERWGTIDGALAVVCWLIGFIIANGTPGTTASDAKITTYFTNHSHQVRAIVAFFVFLLGALLFLSFLGVLRSRLAVAEGGHTSLTALAFGSGVASLVFLVLAASVFTSAGLAANDTGKFHLDPNTYRLMQDLGYELWVASVIVGAMLVWGVSVIAMRTTVFPRWFAWIGVVAGILQLFAIFFIPVFVYWGWILVASALLFWRPSEARPSRVVAPSA